MDDLLLHPEWRQAMKTILEEDPQPGDIIKTETLEQLLEIPTHANSFAEYQRRQLTWLRRFESLRDELLTSHGIWLRSTEGGYEIVPPAKQTELAYGDYSRAAFLKLKRMTRIAQNVRLSELTDKERTDNRNMLAKMSSLLGMVGGAMIEDKTKEQP